MSANPVEPLSIAVIGAGQMGQGDGDTAACRRGQGAGGGAGLDDVNGAPPGRPGGHHAAAGEALAVWATQHRTASLAEHEAAYRQVVAEHKAVVAYRAKYTAPFYLTADSVVTHRASVLLIKRGGNIGKGLWALPGGFLEPREQFYAAALRELAEETGYRALPSQMKAACKTG